MQYVITFFLLITSFFSIAETPLSSAELYGALPEKSMFRVSPSGNKIAYRATSENKDLMIVIDILSGEVIGGLDISEIKPQQAYFIDEDRLIFVSSQNTRIGGFRGRHNVSSAVSYNLTTKEIVRLLTPGYGIYKGQTQVGGIVGLSIDGKYAYMPAYTAEETYSLVKANLDRKRKPKAFQRGKSDVIDYFVNNQDQLLARERYNNDSNAHKVESLIDDEWKTIFEETTEYRTKGFVGLTPDYKNLVMTAQNKAGRWDYYTMSLATGEVSAPLFDHNDKDVESVLSDINRIVYGVRFSGFKPSYEFFDDKLTKLFSDLALQAGSDALYLIDHTPDWSTIIVKTEGSTSAGDYYAYTNDGFEFLATERKNIKLEDIHHISEFSYKARDGLKIPTLITLPKVEKVSNLPAIILPHGGPASYDTIEFDWLAQYFASKGFLVVQPQFRGSKGFGSEHLNKGYGEWGRKMQDDLTDAVNVLAQKGYIDKQNVCIAGWSYGGYAALAGAVFTPELYKCVISINGVADIEAMMKQERRDHGSDHWVVSYWEDNIANGEFDDDHLEQISPINHVSKVQAPILLIHGSRDKVVKLDQSEDMADELEDVKKDVTFVELDKGDHNLSSYKNRMDAMKAIDAFLNKHFN